MFALDLFNNDYERRLAEGAVDQLEQRRIDDLAMKMDDLVARAKQVKDPKHKAALVKEFQKVKAERDSHYKIKDECMGYGSLGEENVNEGAMKDMLWDLSDRMDRDQFIDYTTTEMGLDADEMAEFWDNIHGPMDEGGIPGNVPTEKIPGKEDLLKGRGRKYYEGQAQKKSSKEVTEAQKLHVGDPVIVTAPNEFEGKTGEISEFSPSGKFVVVNLYNHGEHSMHLSDVEYNQYADDQAEEDDWYDSGAEDTLEEQQLDEATAREVVLALLDKFYADMKLPPRQGSHSGALDIKSPGTKVWTRGDGTRHRDPGRIQASYWADDKKQAEKAATNFWPWLLKQPGVKSIGQVSGQFGSSPLEDAVGYKGLYFTGGPRGVEFGSMSRVTNPKSVWRHKPFELEPKAEQGVKEGFQDFNKVEPYEVCLAGKPVKKFDYYEEARRFHDNWKQKLYREGNKEKADRITLMPLNLDEGKWDYPKSMTTIPKYDKDADDYLALHQGAKFARKNKEDRKEWRKAAKAQAHKELMTGKKDVAEAGSSAQQAAIAIAMKKAGKKPKSVDELDASTLKSYADKRGAQVAAMKADNPNPVAGSKEWIQQAVPAQQVGLAKRKIARKERQAGVAEGQQPMNRNAVIQKLEDIYTELYQNEDPESYDLPSAVDYWHSLSADDLAMEFEDAIDRLKQSRGNLAEVKADPTGSWVVYGGNRVVKFKTHSGAKAYAEKNGGKVASSEFYADRIQKQTVSEDGINYKNIIRRVMSQVHVDGGGGNLSYMIGLKAPTMDMLRDVYHDDIERMLDKAHPNELKKAATELAAMFKKDVAEAQTDYQKRRQRERDVDAGKPVPKQREPRMTDYQKKRAQDRKDMELGEDQDNSGVEQAILRRIMVAHTDLLKQFGPEKVMQAAEEVAYNVGDVDEIGTSDVSAYVHQVKQILGA